MRTETSFVGVRLSDEERRKLEALAEATKSTKTRVLRMLLAQADVRRWPEVVLRPEGRPQ